MYFIVFSYFFIVIIYHSFLLFIIYFPIENLMIINFMHILT